MSLDPTKNRSAIRAAAKALIGPPPPLSPDHLPAIGEVAYWFSSVEQELSDLICTLFCVNGYNGLILTSNMTSRQLLDALAVYISTAAEEADRSFLTRTLEKADELLTFRNMALHSIWREGRRPHSIKPLSAEVKFRKLKYKGLSDKEPDYTAEDFFDKAEEMRELLMAIRGWIKAKKPNQAKQK